VSLYKEHFVKTAQGWVPDTLVEVGRLPDFGTMPDPDDSVEGQTTRLYLLEVWIPPKADVGRFRLEVQLKVADWIIRPLEFRVMEARVPEIAAPKTPALLPAVEQASDAAALDAVREYLSGVPLRNDPHPLTVRGIIRRNAIQDLALAASLDREVGGKDAIDRRVIGLLGSNYWFPPRLFGPEWFLRLRDFLYAQPAP
jgi:hypothetical protein